MSDLVQKIVAIILDDAMAMTYQTMVQYRTGLVRAIREYAASQPQEQLGEVERARFLACYEKACESSEAADWYEAAVKAKQWDRAVGKSAIRQSLGSTQERGEAVAWQFYEDGKWWGGCDTNNHRANTEAAGFPTRDLYTTPDAGRVAELEAQLAAVTRDRDIFVESFNERTDRIAELERVKAEQVRRMAAELEYVTALHRNAAQTVDGVLETRRSVERELTESREREGRMREAIAHYDAALKAAHPYGAEGQAHKHWSEARKAALAADQEKNDV